MLESFRRRSRPSASAAALWAPLAVFIEAEARLGLWAERNRWRGYVYEFLRFGLKQAWACLFGGMLLALLIATHFFYPKDVGLARYDFLTLSAVAIQIGLLLLKMETLEEAKVILVFHFVGTVMELFKTSAGSWIYPEPSVLRIGDVPLFSGFMYASVGSYIARAWRLFDFRYTRHPPLWTLALLGVAIYVNFFSHHFILDIRLALFAAAGFLFARTWIHYRVWRVHRRMPLLLSAVLAATFIWIAENIGTFTSTWLYPNQAKGWAVVSIAKLGSWFLLMVISYVMVAAVNRPRGLDEVVPVGTPESPAVFPNETVARIPSSPTPQG